MEDSDVIFLGYNNGYAFDDVLPVNYFEQDNEQRSPPQTGQANGHDDNNNNLDVNEARVINGNQRPQLGNGYPSAAAGSQQDITYGGMHMNIFGNVLNIGNYQEISEPPQPAAYDFTRMALGFPNPLILPPLNNRRTASVIVPPGNKANPSTSTRSATVSSAESLADTSNNVILLPEQASTSTNLQEESGYNLGTKRNCHEPYKDLYNFYESIAKRRMTVDTRTNLQPVPPAPEPALAGAHQPEQLHYNLGNAGQHNEDNNGIVAEEPVAMRRKCWQGHSIEQRFPTFMPYPRNPGWTGPFLGAVYPEALMHPPQNCFTHYGNLHQVSPVRRVRIKNEVPIPLKSPPLNSNAKVKRGRPRKIVPVVDKPQPIQPQPIQPQAMQLEQVLQEPSYNDLLSLEATDLVSSMENVECPACSVWVPAGEGVVLKDCLHTFCRKCLEDTVLYSQTVQIGCPFANEEYKCESYLQDREIKSLVSPEAYENYQGRSATLARTLACEVFDCKTPGCEGWCLLEEGVNEYLCPLCSANNCLRCAAIHPDTDCKDYLRSLYAEMEVGPLDGDVNRDYLSLLRLNDEGLVTNKEKFECPICFSEVEVGEGVVLKECLHNQCRECLASIVRHSETFLVKCPFVNDEYSCESNLQEREIKYLVSPEDYERHLARSLALAESQSQNSFHCKTPDCTGWCLFEENANDFYCLVCNHMNCLACSAIHEGKNCKQYQDWQALNSDTSEEAKKTREYLKKQLQTNKAMECPTCQVIVMKREGCDWLRCSMCRTEICWATRGPRWGKKGFGDTSGGCKCDWKNRKPCHPKCGNCH